MPEQIVIKVGGNVFEAELNDIMTGKAIYGALPIRAKARRWGGELTIDYFVIYDCRFTIEKGDNATMNCYAVVIHDFI
jgi:hypothetical protein